MKNKIISLFICFIFIIEVFPIQVFAREEDINTLTKTATLSEDESEVVIEIETQYEKKNVDILVYQGTYCTAHKLSNSTIITTLNSLLKMGDVDYYADTVHYSNGTRRKNSLKHFEKGITVEGKDIYSTVNENGNHIVSQDCLDTLMETWKNGNYDYLIMILDGGFATGMSGGNNTGIYNVKKSLMLSEEQYLTRMKYAKTLSQIPIIYMMSPLEGSDTLITYDVRKFNVARAYWDEAYFTTTYSRNAVEYLNAHLFIEGLAFLAPSYYLTIIDPNTGKVNLTNPPLAKDIPYNTDGFVFYDNASTVVSKIDTIKDYFKSTKTTITDILADGLIYNSGKVQYFDTTDSCWKDLEEDEDTTVKITEDGQTITAEINDIKAKYNGSKFRFIIDSLTTEEFGSDGNETSTNDGCSVVYKRIGGDIFNTQELNESPKVKFTFLNVNYEDGDHGTLTDIEKETFKKGNKNNTSGSSVKADEHYIHTGWICDKDIILKNGENAKAGDLLTDEQIKGAVVTEELTFTAQYTPIIYKVEYVVKNDKTWGTPEGIDIPTDTNEYNYKNNVMVRDNLTSIQGYAINKETGEKVLGTWKFVSWDKEDFNITENTTITGYWKFTPDIKNEDENNNINEEEKENNSINEITNEVQAEETTNTPLTGDNITKWIIILFICAIGVTFTGFLCKKRK